MFDSQIFIQRRRELQAQLGSGWVLFVGNDNSSINYADNHYPFRQDSNFLYYFGIDKPGLMGVIDIDNDTEALFGNEIDVNNIIWEGNQPSLSELAAKAGVITTYPLTYFNHIIRKVVDAQQEIHFLPPYRPEQEKKLRDWLNLPNAPLHEYISIELIRAIVSQRSYKSREEIEEIEKAMDIGVDMQMGVMQFAKAGMKEVELLGHLYNIALGAGGNVSFPPIVTVNGQTLHNHSYDNVLSPGKMLLCDCGAETSMYYASDLTRTFPVNATFDTRQREIYEIVFNAYQAAKHALKPGVLFKDIHLLASITLVDGLKDIGLMHGDSQEAAQAGAHALFFQCGLGHMMGLDVHDMENLGEKYVGYTPELTQSTEFGLRSLRLGKALEPGFVLTVEPGIYLIPELIDIWQSEHKHAEFINYDKVNTYKDFGGIRIEDDFLITPEGSKLLGKPLASTVAEIEAIRSS